MTTSPTNPVGLKPDPRVLAEACGSGFSPTPVAMLAPVFFGALALSLLGMRCCLVFPIY